MKRNYIKLMMTGILILVFVAGCGQNKNTANEDVNEIVSEDIGNQTSTEAENLEEAQNSQSQNQETASEDEIEKEMAAYRDERGKDTSTIGNYLLAELPSEENYKYGIGSSNSYTARFDARELNEAFKTADDYVKGTLKLESETWECIDPRMTAIYEDEDKGVAEGYDADNIFLCEYNNNGNWQYLILVREKKGSDWKVLYHGSNYKSDERDGGNIK